MRAWQATVQDEAGNAVFNPQVTVYQEDGSTLADIFNEDGSSRENPFIGTTEGFAQFWAERGTYKVVGANGGVSETWQVDLADEEALSVAQSANLAAGVTPFDFGDGALGWQIPINAAILSLHNNGGGMLVIPNIGVPYELTGPVQLRSGVNLVFDGNPTLRLANGANCNVIETFGYVDQAGIGFTSRDNECEKWSLTGKVVLDGNRFNNTNPGPHEGNGLATFGRDYLIEDVYCIDNYRSGAQTHYVASGTTGLSPFGGKVNRLTCHSSGDHGWVNGTSDLMFSNVNILNSSRNESGAFDAAHFIRGARGSGLTIWRVGGVLQNHRYSVYVSSGITLLGTSLSLETGTEGQVRIDGTAELSAIKSYNMIGSGKPHFLINGPNCRVSGSIEQGAIGVSDAVAVEIAGTSVRGANIDLTLSGGFEKIIDVTGTSQGGNKFVFEAGGGQSAPIIVGSVNASDSVDYSQSGGNTRSFRKLPSSTSPVTAAGQDQASALASANALVRMSVSRINSSGPLNTAVVMPASIPGAVYHISNPNARDVLIFPQPGDQFVGLSADQGYTLVQNKSAVIFCDIPGRFCVSGG